MGVGRDILVVSPSREASNKRAPVRERPRGWGRGENMADSGTPAGVEASELGGGVIRS